MKPDKLEQFILENKGDFDDQLPSPQTWEKIKGDIKPVRSINLTTQLIRLAAAVVIFVATYIFIDYTINKGDSGQQMADNPQTEVYDKIPVLMEAKAYYSNQISFMENEVFRLAGEGSPVREEINIEFKELDKVFNELKTDLNDNAANEEVIEAMIQNYRIKLQILEEILLQLKNADEQNTEDHEDKKVLL